jgi:hypothetical protein
MKERHMDLEGMMGTQTLGLLSLVLVRNPGIMEGVDCLGVCLGFWFRILEREGRRGEMRMR